MYYHTQVRNLAHEAELERELIAVKFLQNKAIYDNQQKLRESKRQTPSRKEKDKETALYLARSRIQSQLDASKVGTTAILNRSRIQCALENRQKNQQLNIEAKKSMMQEEKNFLATLQAETQLLLENQRQTDLTLLKQQNLRQDLYKTMLREQEERIRNQVRQQELRRLTYEDEITKQLDRKYGLLSKSYFYY